jgi:hypothetical protein
LPSFSLIESKRSKTWATDIFDSEDWPAADGPDPDPKLVDFSDVNPVGELMFVPSNGGENVPAPRKLPVPPPDPLPPPPPWEALAVAGFEARCDDDDVDGRVLVLGDVRDWPGCEDDCWEPA